MLRRVVLSDHAAAGDGPDIPCGAAGKPRGAAFLAVPRLLVGLAAAKCAPPECDSPARSPTSPLDLRAFSALRGSLLRWPRSPRSWEWQRVGLGGLVDTLADPAAGAMNRIFRPQMRSTKPQFLSKSYTSVPRDCGHPLAEFGKVETAAGSGGGMSVPCSVFYGDMKSGPEVILSGDAHLAVNGHPADLGKFQASRSLPVSMDGPPRYIRSVSATEVEQSEDYTCIIAHGPNPKTIHIFGDCILEPCTIHHGAPDGETRVADEMKEGAESYWLVKCSGDTREEFMNFCFYCKKKLDGNDSCIYRGEKAYCSGNCRAQEILTEKEEVNSTAVSSPTSPASTSSFQDDIFMAEMAVLE